MRRKTLPSLPYKKPDTMLYDANTVLSSLRGVVGFRQNDYQSLSGETLSTLTQSSSGRYFQDFHPLLTLENLYHLARDFADMTTPASGKFEAWLQQKVDAAILQVIDSWISEKDLRMSSANLLRRDTLVKDATAIYDAEKVIDLGTHNPIAGLKIELKREPGLVFTIHEIGIRGTAQEDAYIGLMHSEEKTELKNITINTTTPYETAWAKVGWTLSETGAYFIFVPHGDLNDKLIDWGPIDNQFLPGANHSPSSPLNLFTITGFYIKDGSYPIIWDIRENVYDITTSFGLNIKFSVSCDYTDLITEQSGQFAEAIGLQFAVNMLLEFVHNPSSVVNRHEATMDKSQLLFEIEGDPQGRPTGLRWRLQNALNKIAFDKASISEHCLPCRKKGIRYGAI